MSLQNELENNRDGANRVGSTILAPNSANNSQTTIEATANSHKTNDDKSTPNLKPDHSTPAEQSLPIVETNAKCDTDAGTDTDGSINSSTIDTVIRLTKSDGTVAATATDVATEKSACDTKSLVKSADANANDENDDDEHSSSSNSHSDMVFKGAPTQHISKPNLANLHTPHGRKLNAPTSSAVPLSSPPNVPMFVNRFPNTHPTYLPPHIRNLPKTQSLDLADNEMPSALLTTKQTSFEQNRPIYPNVPYSPYGSPFGSPRNRRRGPLRESRRISIEQTGSFLQLNQYKLMDQIGQVCGHFVKVKLLLLCCNFSAFFTRNLLTFYWNIFRRALTVW